LIVFCCFTFHFSYAIFNFVSRVARGSELTSTSSEEDEEEERDSRERERGPAGIEYLPEKERELYWYLQMRV
jgi:hypothetical protein